MKTLVVYFSRTGYSENVAKEIAKKYDADLDKLTDDVRWDGMWGYLRGARYAMFNKVTQITYSKRSSEYDKIIIVSPVWAGKMPPAIHTYLDKNIENINKLAGIFTSESSNPKKIFDNIEKKYSKKISRLAIMKKKMEQSDIDSAIDELIRE